MLKFRNFRADEEENKESIITEEWRPVVGAEEDYIVSNLGNVASLNYNHTGECRLLKQNLSRGYQRVAIVKNGKYLSVKVHRLVAEAFIPNPEGLPQVNHKDEDKTNNAVWNLEWCDCHYNINYGTGLKRRSKARVENGKGKAIKQIDKSGNTITFFTNVASAARKTGIPRSNIFKALKGKYKTAGNYKWEYIMK